MPDLQGLAFFPGIEQVIGASYTLMHGITPGTIQIEMAPQRLFTTQVGPLEFVYGDLVFVLPECKVDSKSFDVSSSGFLWRLTLVDRRWKWALGSISGVYNRTNEDGTLRSDTEKTPRELCELLFQRMGEQGYDLRFVPNDARPAVWWDYEVPAQALARLAEELGCRIVLRLDSTVAILPAGAGELLPATFDLQADSLTTGAPALPDSLVLVGGPIRYQLDLQLRAVGWDTDDSIRPIDDLSYAPAQGWRQVDFGFCNSITDSKVRARAIASVYRWYQIDPGQLKQVPGYGPIDDVRQILPIGTVQIETVGETMFSTSTIRTRPASVFGVWHDPRRTTEDKNSADSLVPLGDGTSEQDRKLLYDGDFDLEPELGLVKFHQPVYRQSPTDVSTRTFLPAQLVLRTSVVVRDAQSRAVVRYERERPLGTGVGTQPRYLVREEIQPTVIARYGGQYDNNPRVETNQQQCGQQADGYLDAAEQEYVAPAPQTRTYVGLKPIQPDGAIEQVTWSVGLEGAMTRATRNHDATPFVVQPRQRRFAEKARRVASRSRPLPVNARRFGLEGDGQTAIV